MANNTSINKRPFQMSGNISTGKLFFKAVAEITKGNVKAEKRKMSHTLNQSLRSNLLNNYTMDFGSHL